MSVSDLLLEIGCEELPSSFVESAIASLPELATKRFAGLRLTHGAVRAFGTPRRLALLVEGLAEQQPDLSEEVLGPPVRAAFKDGMPTRAATSFAEKLNVTVAELRRIDTPKGEYLAATRSETGRAALELLPAALEGIIREIPFRKSMRWADFDFTFGRPIQWLVALLGNAVVPLTIASKTSGRSTLGHRFLAPAEVKIDSPAAYVDILRKAHVLVDPQERRAALVDALAKACKEAEGTLIEDEFLMGENSSLVEEPYVVVGSFEETFLSLPERVILEVAKGHQRYFGLRSADGKLMPRYLTVVNTALEPALIKKGNDRVMRARLADAQFFYSEDLKIPLAGRRDKLAGVVFQKRLGTVLAKAERIERAGAAIGERLGLPDTITEVAREGANLAKCDLVSLMVGEFPELQGDMGASYALAQGRSRAVAEVIAEHYRPKGASDSTAKGVPAALVAMADRIDTIVGCFGIGLSPTGTADPFGLRRAMLGVLRTMLDHSFDIALPDLVQIAHSGYAAGVLEVPLADLQTKLGDFAGERLRGLLVDDGSSDAGRGSRFPADVVRACLAVGHAKPIDVRRRAAALAGLDAETRAQVGEVFKRANNIASKAPEGEPLPPSGEVHASEAALFEAYARLAARSSEIEKTDDYAALLREVASIAPVMSKYFEDILVMSDDMDVRNNRLRLMRSISERCARVARLELLTEK